MVFSFLLGVALSLLVIPWAFAGQLRLSSNSSRLDTKNVERDAYFIFNSVHHLARQWGTVFAPHGFSCTRGTIPIGTDLYHARTDSNVPESPEWLAFDPEISLAVFASQPEVFLRHYRTTQSLSVLLIDGSSALMTTTGTVDLQDVLLEGQVSSRDYLGMLFQEFPRANSLCAWGGPRGIDGFVRQNLGLELIKCSFEAHMQLVDNLNVTGWKTSFSSPEGSEINTNVAPNIDARLKDQPGRSRLGHKRDWESQYLSSLTFEWSRAAANIYNGPGEHRLRLDTGTMVTVYGREGLPAFKSPNPAHHRLTDLAPEAIRTMKTEIEAYFDSAPYDRSPHPRSAAATSGIDWREVTDRIVIRYGHRLSSLRAFLAKAIAMHDGFVTDRDGQDDEDPIMSARMMLATLLAPHYDLDPKIPMRVNVAKCVSFIMPWQGIRTTGTSEWTASELRLAHAIEYVQTAICDTLIAVNNELSSTRAQRTSVDPDVSSVSILEAIRHSEHRVIKLMDDLRWTMWRGCDRKCDVGEICFVSNWELFRNRSPSPEVNVTRTEPEEPWCANVTTLRGWFTQPVP